MLVDCNIECKTSDHALEQVQTRNVLRDAGFKPIAWIAGCYGGGKPASHTWRVRCTDEELEMIRPLCSKVSLAYQNKLDDEKHKLNEQMVKINERLAEIDKELNG